MAARWLDPTDFRGLNPEPDDVGDDPCRRTVGLGADFAPVKADAPADPPGWARPGSVLVSFNRITEATARYPRGTRFVVLEPNPARYWETVVKPVEGGRALRFDAGALVRYFKPAPPEGEELLAWREVVE